MALHTSQSKNAFELVSRLSENEKIDVRGASTDRLEWLRHNTMITDGVVSLDVMKEAQQLVQATYIDKHKRSM